VQRIAPSASRNATAPLIGFSLQRNAVAATSKAVSRKQVVCRAAAGPWRKKNARLVLEDGSVFTGVGFGAKGTEIGEVVFNTSLSGYQEIMTDPSYKGQFVCFTCPHIGNVGINFGTPVLSKPSSLPV
jgi:carbamoyl-phosphate synthase small subunit